MRGIGFKSPDNSKVDDVEHTTVEGASRSQRLFLVARHADRRARRRHLARRRRRFRAARAGQSAGPAGPARAGDHRATRRSDQPDLRALHLHRRPERRRLSVPAGRLLVRHMSRRRRDLPGAVAGLTHLQGARRRRHEDEPDDHLQLDRRHARTDGIDLLPHRRTHAGQRRLGSPLRSAGLDLRHREGRARREHRIALDPAQRGRLVGRQRIRPAERVVQDGHAHVGDRDSTRWSYALHLPADGSYTIHVRAVDDAGNTTSPAAQAIAHFTVDTTAPPAPSITAKPEAATTARSASFAFGDAEAGAQLLCRRDGSRF